MRNLLDIGGILLGVSMAYAQNGQLILAFSLHPSLYPGPGCNIKYVVYFAHSESQTFFVVLIVNRGPITTIGLT